VTDKGLREVVAADTQISDIDGGLGRLWYVGYDIADLAAHASYEETVYLLHHLDLPTRDVGVASLQLFDAPLSHCSC